MKNIVVGPQQGPKLHVCVFICVCFCVCLFAILFVVRQVRACLRSSGVCMCVPRCPCGSNFQQFRAASAIGVGETNASF